MRMRLGDILVRQRVLTPDLLRQALAYQRDRDEKLGEILVGLGLARRADIARGLAVQRERVPLNEAEIAGTTRLVPRRHLFSCGGCVRPRVSPDGQRIAFLGAQEGERTVFVAPWNEPGAACAVAPRLALRVRDLVWAYDNRHVLYSGDVDGDERWQVCSLDTHSGRDLCLTRGTRLPSGERSKAQILALSPRFPGKVVLEVEEPERWPQVVRVDLRTGRRRRLTRNREHHNQKFLSQTFFVDWNFKVRAAMQSSDGERVLLKTDGNGPGFSCLTLRDEDYWTSEPTQLDASGRYLFLLDSREREKTAAAVFDLVTCTNQIVAEARSGDIESLELDPRNGRIDAVIEYHPEIHVRPLSARFGLHLRHLRGVTSGEPVVVSRSLDDRRWIVTYVEGHRPERHYCYETVPRTAEYFSSKSPELDTYRFAPMHLEKVVSRDGLRLPCYVSLPRGADETSGNLPERPANPLPTIVRVHGGPFARSYWRFDEEHQWLTSRGYAAIDVNFRGSIGFGKHLHHKTDGPWEPEMIEDVIDATHWAIHAGIADSRRIAIMGASYGGYASLMAASQAPELYACAVSLFGVSSLVSHTGSDWTLPHFAGERDLAERFLSERSPLGRLSLLRVPLLIAHGMNDSRVSIRESGQLARALETAGLPFTYLFFPDEGHGLYREANERAFYAATEAFFAQHLGGKLEEFGWDLSGTSLSCPKGRRLMPGLDRFSQALAAIEHEHERGGERLDLSRMRLRELPPAIGTLENLRHLDLSANHLTELPPEMGRLRALRTLSLRGNQLYRLPTEITALTELVELDLRDNQLHEVPPGVGRLPKLRRLETSGNPGPRYESSGKAG